MVPDFLQVATKMPSVTKLHGMMQPSPKRKALFPHQSLQGRPEMCAKSLLRSRAASVEDEALVLECSDVHVTDCQEGLSAE